MIEERDEYATKNGEIRPMHHGQFVYAVLPFIATFSLYRVVIIGFRETVIITREVFGAFGEQSKSCLVEKKNILGHREARI